MRKLEGVVKEITDEMDYLKRREERMRDTNGTSCLDQSLTVYIKLQTSDPMQSEGAESTNSRVQNFALLTIMVLIALGAWQVSGTTAMHSECIYVTDA